MEIRNKELLEILLEFNKYLTQSISIVAIGGTALTLLGKKASTKDIDLCFLEEKDRKTFIKTAIRIGYRLESPNRLIGRNLAVDIYTNGYIFAVQLPENYIEKSISIKKMEKIDLCALSPLDLIVTKAARLNKRDEEDIIAIITSYKIDQDQLVERYIQTMENSMVRDAKDHLLVLFSILKNRIPIDKTAFEKAGRWAHG